MKPASKPTYLFRSENLTAESDGDVSTRSYCKSCAELTNEEKENSLMASRLERVSERVTEMHATLVHLLAALHGNGVLGILVRLDRIEEKEKRRSWVSKTALAAVIVSVVGLVFAWLIKH